MPQPMSSSHSISPVDTITCLAPYSFGHVIIVEKDRLPQLSQTARVSSSTSRGSTSLGQKRPLDQSGQFSPRRTLDFAQTTPRGIAQEALSGRLRPSSARIRQDVEALGIAGRPYQAIATSLEDEADQQVQGFQSRQPAQPQRNALTQQRLPLPPPSILRRPQTSRPTTAPHTKGGATINNASTAPSHCHITRPSTARVQSTLSSTLTFGRTPEQAVATSNSDSGQRPALGSNQITRLFPPTPSLLTKPLPRPHTAQSPRSSYLVVPEITPRARDQTVRQSQPVFDHTLPQRQQPPSLQYPEPPNSARTTATPRPVTAGSTRVSGPEVVKMLASFDPAGGSRNPFMLNDAKYHDPRAEAVTRKVENNALPEPPTSHQVEASQPELKSPRDSASAISTIAAPQFVQPPALHPAYQHGCRLTRLNQSLYSAIAHQGTAFAVDASNAYSHEPRGAALTGPAPSLGITLIDDSDMTLAMSTTVALPKPRTFGPNGPEPADPDDEAHQSFGVIQKEVRRQVLARVAAARAFQRAQAQARASKAVPRDFKDESETPEDALDDLNPDDPALDESKLNELLQQTEFNSAMFLPGSTRLLRPIRTPQGLLAQEIQSSAALTHRENLALLRQFLDEEKAQGDQPEKPTEQMSKPQASSRPQVSLEPQAVRLPPPPPPSSQLPPPPPSSQLPPPPPSPTTSRKPRHARNKSMDSMTSAPTDQKDDQDREDQSRKSPKHGRHGHRTSLPFVPDVAAQDAQSTKQHQRNMSEFAMPTSHGPKHKSRDALKSFANDLPSQRVHAPTVSKDDHPTLHLDDAAMGHSMGRLEPLHSPTSSQQSGVHPAIPSVTEDTLSSHDSHALYFSDSESDTSHDDIPFDLLVPSPRAGLVDKASKSPRGLLRQSRRRSKRSDDGDDDRPQVRRTRPHMPGSRRSSQEPSYDQLHKMLNELRLRHDDLQTALTKVQKLLTLNQNQISLTPLQRYRLELQAELLENRLLPLEREIAGFEDVLQRVKIASQLIAPLSTSSLEESGSQSDYTNTTSDGYTSDDLDTSSDAGSSSITSASSLSRVGSVDIEHHPDLSGLFAELKSKVESRKREKTQRKLFDELNKAVMEKKKKAEQKEQIDKLKSKLDMNLQYKIHREAHRMQMKAVLSSLKAMGETKLKPHIEEAEEEEGRQMSRRPSQAPSEVPSAASDETSSSTSSSVHSFLSNKSLVLGLNALLEKQKKQIEKKEKLKKIEALVAAQKRRIDQETKRAKLENLLAEKKKRLEKQESKLKLENFLQDRKKKMEESQKAEQKAEQKKKLEDMLKKHLNKPTHQYEDADDVARARSEHMEALRMIKNKIEESLKAHILGRRAPQAEDADEEAEESKATGQAEQKSAAQSESTGGAMTELVNPKFQTLRVDTTPTDAVAESSKSAPPSITVDRTPFANLPNPWLDIPTQFNNTPISTLVSTLVKDSPHPTAGGILDGPKRHPLFATLQPSSDQPPQSAPKHRRGGRGVMGGSMVMGNKSFGYSWCSLDMILQARRKLLRGSNLLSLQFVGSVASTISNEDSSSPGAGTPSSSLFSEAGILGTGPHATEAERQTKAEIEKMFPGATPLPALPRSAVVTWGRGHFGQLGLGDLQVDVAQPTLLPLRESVLMVASSEVHTLILTESGTVYAFGDNTFGQLGLGDKERRASPFSLHFANSPFNKRKIRKISAGPKWSAFLTADKDEVYIAGSAAYGVLGCDIVDRKTRAEIERVKRLIALEYRPISAAHESSETGGREVPTMKTSASSSSLLSQRSGEPASPYIGGQSGTGGQLSLDARPRTPTLSSGQLGELSASSGGSTPVSSSPSLRGRALPSLSHQGSALPSTPSVTPSAAAVAAAVRAAGGHSQLRLQLRSATASSSSSPPPSTRTADTQGSPTSTTHRSRVQDVDAVFPIPIPDLKDKQVVQIEFGSDHAAALTASGDLYTWGSTVYGQTGHPMYPEKVMVAHGLQLSLVALKLQPASAAPQVVPLIPPVLTRPKHLVGGGSSLVQWFKHIACGRQFMLAVGKDANTYAWGLNNEGQIGATAGPIVYEPRTVRSLLHVPAYKVYASMSHAAVITEEGHVYSSVRVPKYQFKYPEGMEPKMLGAFRSSLSPRRSVFSFFPATEEKKSEDKKPTFESPFGPAPQPEQTSSTPKDEASGTTPSAKATASEEEANIVLRGDSQALPDGETAPPQSLNLDTLPSEAESEAIIRQASQRALAALAAATTKVDAKSNDSVQESEQSQSSCDSRPEQPAEDGSSSPLKSGESSSPSKPPRGRLRRLASVVLATVSLQTEYRRRNSGEYFAEAFGMAESSESQKSPDGSSSSQSSASDNTDSKSTAKTPEGVLIPAPTPQASPAVMAKSYHFPIQPAFVRLNTQKRFCVVALQGDVTYAISTENDLYTWSSVPQTLEKSRITGLPVHPAALLLKQQHSDQMHRAKESESKDSKQLNLSLLGVKKLPIIEANTVQDVVVGTSHFVCLLTITDLKQYLPVSGPK